MRRPRRKTIIVSSAIIAALVLGWFFGPSGLASGVEFSPDKFSHRSFRYYQWCGIQITPAASEEWYSEIDQYLHDQNFIPPSGNAKPRWDFVKGFAPGVRGWTGNAASLCRSIGCWSDDDRWIRWSEKNPEFARILWPSVVEMARQEKYYEIKYLLSTPELEEVSSEEELREIIKRSEAFGDEE